MNVQRARLVHPPPPAYHRPRSFRRQLSATSAAAMSLTAGVDFCAAAGNGLRSTKAASPPPVLVSPNAASAAASAAATALLQLPASTTVHGNQVAGHVFETGKSSFGMLRDQRDGSILKAANKPMCGRREIRFYERINRTASGKRTPTNADDSDDATWTSAAAADLHALKALTSEYRGVVQIPVSRSAALSDEQTHVDFIRLADITAGMTEPCIMDIKIGQQTWDPLATAAKRTAEQQKYHACKSALGLCVPGFQVYNVRTGVCRRFGKDYGKNLTAASIKSALALFLNAEHGLCRALLVQILSGLWSIQKWARGQRTVRLYCSSVLIAYDARLLRNHLDVQRKANAVSPAFTCQVSPSHSPKSGRLFVGERNGSLTGGSAGDLLSPFDWSASPASSPSRSSPLRTGEQSPAAGTPTTPVEIYRKVQRNHSVRNNYDEDLKDIRESYALMLDNLIGGFKSAEWVHVRMIDFAHAFDAAEVDELLATKTANGSARRAADAVDANYLFGIESAVRLFEEFLVECQ